MGHWIVISIRRMPRKECKKGIIVMTIHRKKRIYISGPMRGKKESESREAFAEAQALLEASGCTAIDPWDIQEFLPNMTEEEYLLFDLFIINYMCDAIFMLPGWTTSLGARQEFQMAVRHGKELQYHEEAEPADYDI